MHFFMTPGYNCSDETCIYVSVVGMIFGLRVRHLEWKARSGFSLYLSSFSGLSHFRNKNSRKTRILLSQTIDMAACMFTRLPGV